VAVTVLARLRRGGRCAAVFVAAAAVFVAQSFLLNLSCYSAAYKYRKSEVHLTCIWVVSYLYISFRTGRWFCISGLSYLLESPTAVC